MSREKGLSTNWNSHLKGEEKDNFDKYIRNAISIIERLDSVLVGKIDEASKPKKSDYDSPSWAYKQADTNGYLRALNELRTLTQHIRK